MNADSVLRLVQRAGASPVSSDIFTYHDDELTKLTYGLYPF